MKEKMPLIWRAVALTQRWRNVCVISSKIERFVRIWWSNYAKNLDKNECNGLLLWAFMNTSSNLNSHCFILNKKDTNLQFKFNIFTAVYSFTLHHIVLIINGCWIKNWTWWAWHTRVSFTRPCEIATFNISNLHWTCRFSCTLPGTQSQSCLLLFLCMCQIVHIQAPHQYFRLRIDFFFFQLLAHVWWLLCLPGEDGDCLSFFWSWCWMQLCMSTIDARSCCCWAQRSRIQVKVQGRGPGSKSNNKVVVYLLLQPAPPQQSPQRRSLWDLYTPKKPPKSPLAGWRPRWAPVTAEPGWDIVSWRIYNPS